MKEKKLKSNFQICFWWRERERERDYLLGDHIRYQMTNIDNYYVWDRYYYKY